MLLCFCQLALWSTEKTHFSNVSNINIMRIVRLLWESSEAMATHFLKLFLGCFAVCDADRNIFTGKVEPLSLKVTRNRCKGCDKLRNCTTYDGSVQIEGIISTNAAVLRQLSFPRLTEITGHLLVSLVYTKQSLKDIFPKLAVIRGRASDLFLDYSLVIYQNDGLRQINLPSLTTILSGGVRIEKNINLCYVDTVRWKSIMKTSSEDNNGLVISSNNNDCYNGCYKKVCVPPAGHGASGIEYCWSEGKQGQPSCQRRKYPVVLIRQLCYSNRKRTT